uniref:Uncharacterized protein n=1 Tax=Rhizophora mucronata TaxID=61149 RepID=A0A2P2IP72_RHIMU
MALHGFQDMAAYTNILLPNFSLNLIRRGILLPSSLLNWKF